MSQCITDIPGMSGEVLQLFQAAGFGTSGELVKCSTGEVADRLAAANEAGGIVSRMPSEAAIGAWIAAARVLESLGARDEKVSLNTETMRRVRESAVMHARPVLGRELMEAGIPVSAVPIADFVGGVRRGRSLVDPRERERGGGRENTRRSERKREAEELPGPPLPAPAPQDGEGDGEPVSPPVESLPKVDAGTDDAMKSRHEVVPEGPIMEVDPELAEVSPRTHDPEEVLLEDAPQTSELEEEDGLNFRGIDELSMVKKGLERRNSGMTHKDPARVVLSALSTITLVLGGGATGLTVIVVGAYHMAANLRFPLWLPVLLGVTLFCMLQFVFFGVKARCRLCGYRLFVPKACHKHEKAPRSVFGSGFATALQVVFKHSWRCMFCGTKQKLR